jgi:hypothetical protein
VVLNALKFTLEREGFHVVGCTSPLKAERKPNRAARRKSPMKHAAKKPADSKYQLRVNFESAFKLLRRIVH